MPVASPSHLFLGLFGMPGGWEWAVVLIIGLLVFGRRLPEIGRSLGSSIVEFKRGIKGIGEEIESEAERGDSSPAQLDLAPRARPRWPHAGSPRTEFRDTQN